MARQAERGGGAVSSVEFSIDRFPAKAGIQDFEAMHL